MDTALALAMEDRFAMAVAANSARLAGTDPINISSLAGVQASTRRQDAPGRTHIRWLGGVVHEPTYDHLVIVGCAVGASLVCVAVGVCLAKRTRLLAKCHARRQRTKVKILEGRLQVWHVTQHLLKTIRLLQQVPAVTVFTDQAASSGSPCGGASPPSSGNSAQAPVVPVESVASAALGVTPSAPDRAITSDAEPTETSTLVGPAPARSVSPVKELQTIEDC